MHRHLVARRRSTRLVCRPAESYHEFLSDPGDERRHLCPARRAQTDPQTPHAEDEIYHVLGGRGRIEMDGADHPVGPGDTVFVAAGVEHRFHSITEDLTLLVVFAPAHSG